jgi:hypothetical protein
MSGRGWKINLSTIKAGETEREKEQKQQNLVLISSYREPCVIIPIIPPPQDVLSDSITL